MTFLSNHLMPPLTNPKTHDAFESFCAPVFCDFIWHYFLDMESNIRTHRHLVDKSNSSSDLVYFINISHTLSVYSYFLRNVPMHNGYLCIFYILVSKLKF